MLRTVKGKEITATVGFRLPPDLYHRVTDLAEERGERVSATLRDLVRRGLTEGGKQGAPEGKAVEMRG